MQQAIIILALVSLCGSVHGQNQTKPGASLPYYNGVPSGRIVNGQTVDIAYFPYTVGLRVGNGQICGGSIITAKHVLTAAHCLANRPPVQTVAIHAGSTSQSTGGRTFQASYYVIHPNYNPTTTDYDAAIIAITTSFAGYQNIAGIGLQEVEVADSTSCYAVGWGATNGATMSSPDKLQYTVLQSISTLRCLYFYSYISPQMICAQSDNSNVCSGDSGGPLICNGRLTGIVSFGKYTTPPCQLGSPSVFAKVASSSIRSFIRTYAGI